MRLSSFTSRSICSCLPSYSTTLRYRSISMSWYSCTLHRQHPSKIFHCLLRLFCQALASISWLSCYEPPKRYCVWDIHRVVLYRPFLSQQAGSSIVPMGHCWHCLSALTFAWKPSTQFTPQRSKRYPTFGAKGIQHSPTYFGLYMQVLLSHMHRPMHGPLQLWKRSVAFRCLTLYLDIFKSHQIIIKSPLDRTFGKLSLAITEKSQKSWTMHHTEPTRIAKYWGPQHPTKVSKQHIINDVMISKDNVDAAMKN